MRSFVSASANAISLVSWHYESLDCLRWEHVFINNSRIWLFVHKIIRQISRSSKTNQIAV